MGHKQLLYVFTLTVCELMIRNYPVRMGAEVKHLSWCVYVRVIKNTAVLLQNGSLPLSFAIPILQKMPTKLGEPSI